MLVDCNESELGEVLPGRTVVEVGRVGKFVLIRLDGPGEFWLTVHLGMTGQILLSEAGVVGSVLVGAECGPPAPLDSATTHPHTRFVFRLEGRGGERQRLEFRDMRKFGRVQLSGGGPAPRVRRLGPDAWRGEWDVEYLAARLDGRKTPLKAFLLDQRNLAGIGNIYADETLWRAQLSPLRVAGSLSPQEVARLAQEVRHCLSEGVRRLGCTLADFVDIKGNPGRFQETLQAYGRHGELCSRCGGTLVRVVVAGRGTTYCPGCQL
jgi:formamidopyrimidine-DNA glycosylase